MTLTTPRSRRLTGAALLAAVALATSAAAAMASVDPGTPDKDVHIGKDNDNASNPFIQPPGVAAPQHMNDTDLLFGRGNADLLVGNKGNDVLLGGPGPDILVGGIDRGGDSGNDVMVADDGDDVEIWSPGDGNDIADGNDGTDTLIVGPVLTNSTGLRLDTWTLNRAIPKVDLAGCHEPDLRAGPGPRLGAPRRAVPAPPDGRWPAAEHAARQGHGGRGLPRPLRRQAAVADLTAGRPSFSTVPVPTVRGLAGAIVAPLPRPLHTRPTAYPVRKEAPMTGTVDRALVIGSSIAGLLAARALSEAYSEVIVLDRDELPYGPVARGGVPQIRHAHGLLAGGREAMEELLPGLTADLVAAGATAGDAQESMDYYVGTGRYATGTSGLTAVAVSRVLLEWTIRRRVAETPGVVFYDRSSVLDLMFSEDGRRVTGLVVSSVDRPGSPRRLEADLVVDASGRTSRTPEWLERRGFQPPEEERVRCDISYATRRFRRRPGDAGTALAILQPASAAVPRSGVLIAQENDEWIGGLTGYHGVRPPTELSEFLAYARTLEAPAIAEVLERLEPLDDGCTYRFQASVRRRYERLLDVPDGILVIGDALCSFDPAFGQGMSTAALEAVALRAALAEGREDLGRRFFHRAAQYIDTPWQIVVGGMPPAPGTTVRKPMSARLVGSYLNALRYAAVDDPKLARAFLRVAHMTAPPQSLMTPGLAARVFARVLLNRAAVAGPAPGVVPTPYGLGHGVTHRPRPLAAVSSTQPPGRTDPVHHKTGHLS